MRSRVPGGWWTAALVAVATLTVVVLVLTLLGRLPGTGPSSSAAATTSTSATASTPRATPSDGGVTVLEPVGAAGPIPTTGALARLLGPLLAQPALGPHVGAAVTDLATGHLLYGRHALAGYEPASTTKLLTAAAALSTLGPTYRISTTVVAGARPGQVVIVGGGDPTLATAPVRGLVPAPASLPALARATAARLRAAGETAVVLQYDTGLFTGPATAPTWPPSYVASGIVAPVSALTVDEGRVGLIAEGPAPRVTDPALSAARAFARQLGRFGITVRGVPVHGRAPATAPPTVSPSASASAVPVTPGTLLGTVRSPQLADLVGWMLSTSDNDLAEALAHLVARAAGQPASFAGGVAAVTNAVAELGLPVGGLALFDGSGLSTQTRVAPALLASVLASAASADHAPLRPLLTGLAVAGFTGSLEPPRFEARGTGEARGLVRGKTGTLTGVSAIAGTVDDADGRVLAFVFVADRVPIGGTLPARDALDRLASAVAACGCG